MSHIIITNPYLIAKIERLARATGKTAREYASEYFRRLVESADLRCQSGNTYPKK